MQRFISLVSFSLVVCLMVIGVSAQEFETGKALPIWQKGFMDIHHINTGRGNAAYCILPDGTTLLIDAGELSPLDKRTFTPRNATQKPDSLLKPFEWLVHYIQRVAPPFNSSIDYAVITHFHDDHFGAWYPSAPAAASGNFKLTGITGVAEKIPVRTLIDRAYPDYNYPYDMKKEAAKYAGGEIAFDSTMSNYFSFIKEKIQGGMTVAALQTGSRQQIFLKNEPEKFTNFYVQNIKCGPYIWNRENAEIVKHFPEGALPGENSLSLALTINYGPFSYFTGGDNSGNLITGEHVAKDVETPVAKAAGEVDVAVMNHHGNRDAINENSIRFLNPAVWIGQTWSADHPGHEVLIRLTNSNIVKMPGDLFCTNMLEANRLVIGPSIDRLYKSQQGHIVIRVLPGGKMYYIIILDDSTPKAPVKSVHGPYYSKEKK